jgi:hypothetical protein
MSNSKPNTTYRSKPLTASEIQQQNYERQMRQYQEQVQQYQQQWMQYQQQVMIAQQLSQQYPQYVQPMPQMQLPAYTYVTPQIPQTVQPPVQTVPYPGQSTSQRPPAQNTQSHQPQQKYQPQKKFKKQKQVIVKTCTPCEKDFTSLQQYEIHLQSHIKCQFCPFEAHYKVVASHQQTAHPTGYHVLISQSVTLETQEEIDEWIKQRKKNFPTRQKIEEQEVEDGEVVEKRKYESSESDSDTEEEKGTESIVQKKGKCKFFAKGKCKKGDACPFLHEVIPPPSTLFEKVFGDNNS